MLLASKIGFLGLVVVFSISAQSALRASITATGEATLSASPDQATLAVSVVNTAGNAITAASQNAELTSTVIAALRAVMAASDALQTISYSLNSNYNNQGNPTGFTATNTIQVTTGDLTSPGRLIDTATQAGATRIQSLSFGLKDSQPLRAQALKLAAGQAQVQVQAIANGLGVKLGSVISATDGSSATPVISSVLLGVPSSTPIVTGVVQVTASVRLQVEIVP